MIWSDDAVTARSAAGLLGLPSLSRLDGEGGLRIWLCIEPTDMRRGFDRLAAQAEQVTGQDPRPAAARQPRAEHQGAQLPPA